MTPVSRKIVGAVILTASFYVYLCASIISFITFMLDAPTMYALSLVLIVVHVLFTVRSVSLFMEKDL